MIRKNIPAALLKELRKDHLDHNRCILLLQEDARAAGYADSRGVTPLMAAAEASYAYLAKLLVQNGASVSAADDKRRTPLHYAAFAPTFSDELIRHLCGNGADIDAPDAKKSTPLHHAVRYANLPAARLLVVLGADTQACDANGDTPIKLAQRLSRGPTFVNALTAPVTAAEKAPPVKEPARPTWTPTVPRATQPLSVPAAQPFSEPAAQPLSEKDLGEMKKALKAAFRRATAPGAATDVLTIATTAQALLAVDARLREAARSPRA